MKAPRAFSRLTLGALAGALAACAGAMPFMLGTRDHIRIPHARHAKADVDCSTCHETIFDSTSLETRNLPKEKKCTGCHKKEKEQCDFCHNLDDMSADTKKEKKRAREMLEMVATINKKFMGGKEEVSCVTCHRGKPKPDAK